MRGVRIHQDIHLINAGVAQLARASDSYPEGRMFNSYLWHHSIYSRVAQSVERVTVNHDVVGSSPTPGATVAMNK